MKKLFSIATLVLYAVLIQAQVEKPAQWSYKSSKTSAKIGETIEIVFTAELKKGWYMYSVGPYEMAPSTTFAFEKNATYELVGNIKPIKAKHKVDEYIGEYDYFTDKAEFVQKVKILSDKPQIKGTFEYSTCSLETGVCLPPKDEEFSLGSEIEVSGMMPLEEPKKTEKAMVKEKTPVKSPQSEIIATTASSENAAAVVSDDSSNNTIEPNIVQNTVIENRPIEQSKSDYWGFFILAFLSGLVALLTPCVFPMIPMTVTFFLNSGKSRTEGIFKAVFYGLSIIGIYTVIGTLVARFAGAEAANFLSTHWLPNLFFFATFVLFAMSFLGMFEITLPSWLVNASDRQSDKGGYLGVFFMACTLVLVSFSCTGPIVGTLLVESAGGAFVRPMIGMFAFSLAFALPFTLFAIFPSWLKNLPKSGGWLNTVKVVLGFLELALAFKFLSLADQAYHWGILNRDVNIAIWISIFFALAMYLFGFITLPHDDKVERIGVIRLILAIISLSFAIYLAPGLWGAPLKPLSGYLPPLSTLDFKQEQKDKSGIQSGNICSSPRFGNLLHLPHNLQGYFDYKQALECSKQLKKPIFIDFTGHGCVNCREMEANVWSHPEVLKRLQNDFILLALYVDDKTELPENEWYTSAYDGKVKKSIGKQNADFQITKYNNNAQPYYLVVDSDGNTLSGPKAYDLNVENFVAFLEAGKGKYVR